MDTGAVADTLMSALTRVQTALAPPPDTAGDAEYAAQVEDDLHWLEQWQSTERAAARHKDSSSASGSAGASFSTQFVDCICM